MPEQPTRRKLTIADLKARKPPPPSPKTSTPTPVEPPGRVENKQKADQERAKWRAAHPETAPRKVQPRPWGMPPEASRAPPWWCVKRVGPHGVSHLAVYRHISRENADREAAFLAAAIPGAVYCVLEAVAIHCVGAPEVSLGPDRTAAPAAPAAAADGPAEMATPQEAPA